MRSYLLHIILESIGIKYANDGTLHALIYVDAWSMISAIGARLHCFLRMDSYKTTNYGLLERKKPSLRGQKFTPTP